MGEQLTAATPSGFSNREMIEKDSMPAWIHDLAGLSLEHALCHDQVDPSNLASIEVMVRLYQMLEETGCTLQIEGSNII